MYKVLQCSHQSISEQSDQPIEKEAGRDENPSVQPGDFDGLSILRYAHIFRERSSGGTEQYLRLLDCELLSRHKLTIYRTYLTEKTPNSNRHEEEPIGVGKIVWVPIFYLSVSRSFSGILRRMRFLSDINSEGCRSLFGKSLELLYSLLRHRGGHLRYRHIIYSDGLNRLICNSRISLLSLHWCSYDSERLVRTAYRSKVPVVAVNHFENSKLNKASAIKIENYLRGIGGVSHLGVPPRLFDRYQCVSDAVDLNLFSPNEKLNVTGFDSPPKVLLPGRITPGKGHHDLLRAGKKLKDKGLSFELLFVGVVEDQGLLNHLYSVIAQMGLQDSVKFLGPVKQTILKNLYEESTLVVLPSQHEGLGRVLLEAQAMRTPVIGYHTGGIPCAMEDGITGFLVPTGDIEGLAMRIESILDNPKLQYSMGIAGRAFVESKFGLKTLTKRHESFYRNAIGFSTSANS